MICHCLSWGATTHFGHYLDSSLILLFTVVILQQLVIAQVSLSALQLGLDLVGGLLEYPLG